MSEVRSRMHNKGLEVIRGYGALRARPFLKWVGGKTQLLTQMEPFIPKRFGRYHEPFVGAGALFYHLAHTRAHPSGRTWATLSDANKELIYTYQAVRDDLPRVMKWLRYHEEDYKLGRENAFYTIRDRGAEGITRIAARMIFLNKTCFNGVYRVNKKGEFNAPPGKFKSEPVICDEENLKACSKALRGATLLPGDFEDAVDEAREDDFVYFDPPYVPVSTTSNFTSYTKGGFSLEDQERLCSVAWKLKRRGVVVLLSNSDTKLVRRLYAKGFHIEEARALRSVNSKTSRRGHVGELLIY